MSRVRSAYSLIGFVVLSVVAFPAAADTATEQVGVQEAIINGDNNQVTQVINQITVEHPGRGRGLTNRYTQDVHQGATVDGSGNDVHQESTQVNHSESNHPGRRVGQTGNQPHAK